MHVNTSNLRPLRDPSQSIELPFVYIKTINGFLTVLLLLLIEAMIIAILRRCYSTLKSKNDEALNQGLLKRIKNISIIDERKKVPLQKTDDTQLDQQRTLTQNRLKKIVELYYQDALVYNPSVLGRTYRIHEKYCSEIVNYIKPLVFLENNTMESTTKILKGSIVVDVARLKSDENYLTAYKRIVFPSA